MPQSAPGSNASMEKGGKKLSEPKEQAKIGLSLQGLLDWIEKISGEVKTLEARVAQVEKTVADLCAEKPEEDF